jgi:hypothetical protein
MDNNRDRRRDRACSMRLRVNLVRRHCSRTAEVLPTPKARMQRIRLPAVLLPRLRNKGDTRARMCISSRRIKGNDRYLLRLVLELVPRQDNRLREEEMIRRSVL